MSDSKLRIGVSGSKIRKLREKLGWTQTELAKKAGYSERLIRKAEACGIVRFDTLQVLRDTFSLHLGPISMEDLKMSILDVAKRVVHSYDHHGIDMLKHCSDDLTDDFEYHIHADPTNVPYAGRWIGHEGLQQMLTIFFGIFRRDPGTLSPDFLVGDSRVHARFLDQAWYSGGQTPPIIINLHFEFRGLQVCRMDNEFDSDLTASTLNNAK